VFLINSRLESFIAPQLALGETSRELTSSYFAEFLNEGSPVHLRLPAQSTCVGFSTDNIRSVLAHSIEDFPGTTLSLFLPPKRDSKNILDYM
jgi:hypothetical protein